MNARRARKRTHALPILAAAAATILTLAGCGGSGPAGTAHLEITHTATTDRVVEPGQHAAYEITLRNTGRAEARNISLKGYDGHLSSVVDVQCKQVSGGAACPAPMTFTPNVLELPAGASITFEFTFLIDPKATGVVNDTVFVRSSYEDEDVMEKVSVHDAFSGAYRLYATQGAVLDANVDFLASSLAVKGGAGDQGMPFLRDEVSPEYDIYKPDTEPKEIVSAFLTTTDLLVGSLDLGAGVQPFVAARDFVSTLAELDGQSFVILGRDAATGGAAATQAWAARFEGTTLVACRTAAPLSVENCPALTRYALAQGADGAFTRTDPVTGETVAFRVARSGDTRVYLSADAPAGHQRLEIGLQPKADFERQYYAGGDTQGQWGALTLSPGNYAGEWNTGGSPFISALAQVPGGPAGLFAARRQTDGAAQFVVAQGSLAFVLGAPGGSGEGELQVWTETDQWGNP